MFLNEKSSLPYLQFPNLMNFPFVRHGIFTRLGGVSQPPFNELNISFSTGDMDADIKQNRERICREMENLELVFAHQVHGEAVLFVEDRLPDAKIKYRNQGKGDAMVTAVSGICLVLQVADCQPVLLLDPVKKVIGAVHSGWRGSISDIVGKTVAAMNTRYGCDSGDIRVGIGPSLGPCCGEFINHKTEIPEHLWKYKTAMNHFDFWSMTIDQLKGRGVAKENIHVSRICTVCNTDRFYSHRKEKQTGRFAAVIGLT